MTTAVLACLLLSALAQPSTAAAPPLPATPAQIAAAGAAALPPANPNYTLIYTPVVFTIYYYEDPLGVNPTVGKVNFESLIAQMEQLNKAYSATEAIAAGYAKATDSKIRFFLHSVVYYNNTEYNDLCLLQTYDAPLKWHFHKDTSRYLNVYVCFVANQLGMAWLPYQPYTYPWSYIDSKGVTTCEGSVVPAAWGCPVNAPLSESSYYHGIYLHYDLLPGNSFQGGVWSQGDILTHEVGHTFGLLHPYAYGCADTNNVLGLTDDIPDTPRTSGNPLGKTCAQAKNTDSCPLLPGKDDIQNYMTAYADSCRSHFTPGQVAWMRSIVDTTKTVLAQQRPTDCRTTIDATDNAPDFTMCYAAPKTDSTHSPTPRMWCHTDAASSWGFACCPGVDGTGCAAQDWSQFSILVPGGPTPPPLVPTTASPTGKPSKYPTTFPTKKATGSPTSKPSKQPTAQPSNRPSKQPTARPTHKPTTAAPSKKNSSSSSTDPDSPSAGDAPSSSSSSSEDGVPVSALAGGGAAALVAMAGALAVVVRRRRQHRRDVLEAHHVSTAFASSTNPTFASSASPSFAVAVRADDYI